MSWLSFYRMATRIRFFSDAGGSTCGTESAKSATTERSSWYWRAHLAHCVRCARAASRSSEVTASSAYAPDSSSNSRQVIAHSPCHLPDKYYDLHSAIDYILSLVLHSYSSKCRVRCDSLVRGPGISFFCVLSTSSVLSGAGRY